MLKLTNIIYQGFFVMLYFLCTEKGLKLAILMYHVFLYTYFCCTQKWCSIKNIRSPKTFVSSNFYFPKSLNKLTANNISLFNFCVFFLFLQQHLSVFCIIFLNPFALLKFIFLCAKIKKSMIYIFKHYAYLVVLQKSSCCCELQKTAK